MSTSNLVKIQKVNEVYIKIESNAATMTQIHEEFSFFSPSYQFAPQYRYGNWDGKIRLLTKNGLLYAGLFPKLVEFLDRDDLEYKILENKYYQSPETVDELINPEDIINFCKELHLPHTPYDYQYVGVYECLRNYRKIIKSATGSGKSLVIYVILKFLLNIEIGNILLITSSPGLCKQFVKDFKDYGFEDVIDFVNTPEDVKKGKQDKLITVVNYHLIAKKDKQYFSDYNAVICDEVHKATTDSITNIMTKLDNAVYRFGFSGSINEDVKVNPLIIAGLFGEIKTIRKAHESIESGQSAAVQINCIELKHNEDDFFTYQEEDAYLYKCEKRSDFIVDLAMSQEKNTLIAYKNTEQGKYIFNELKKQNDATFWIYGKTSVEEREAIRQFTEDHENVIIVACYQVFQEGINIKNLNNLIFAQAGKGFERVIQIIGRILRLKKDNSTANVFDLSDDFKYSKRHAKERIKIYNGERFPVSLSTFELED